MLQTLLLSVSLVSSPGDLDGHWIGALVHDDGAVPVEVTIDGDGASAGRVADARAAFAVGLGEG